MTDRLKKFAWGDDIKIRKPPKKSRPKDDPPAPPPPAQGDPRDEPA